MFVCACTDESGGSESENGFVQRDHAFPGGMVLKIREFEFHQVNANLLWPGTCMFSEWLFNHLGLLNGRRILELGSGTGALTIFLKKAFNLDITTSDYDDEEIEHNIAFNCQANGVAVSPHIRHTWGDDFPVDKPGWDLILASDILLYVKQYPNLITTLTFLLLRWNPQCTLGETQNASHHNDQGEGKDVLYEAKSADIDVKEESEGQRKTKIIAVPTTLPKPCFLMSWRRRIPKQDEDVFFNGCRAAGLCVINYGSCVYCISPNCEQ